MYGRLEEVLGVEEAATMMAHLPPVGWADVATKRDLDALGSLLRAEVATQGAALRAEMATQGAELRTEMANVRGELAVLGTELRGEIAVLGSDLRGEIKAGNAELLRTLFFGMVASNATLVGLVFAAVRLA
jgi:hypothetical protein